MARLCEERLLSIWPIWEHTALIETSLVVVVQLIKYENGCFSSYYFGLGLASTI